MWNSLVIGVLAFALVPQSCMGASQTTRLELQHGKTAIQSVHNMPDGKQFVSASFDGTVVMWNAQSGRRVWSRDLDEGSKVGNSHTVSHIVGMDISPDGNIVAVSYSQGHVVGDTLKGKDEHHIALLGAIDGRVRKLLTQTDHVGRVAFSPDGSLLVSESADSTARLWNIQTGEEVLLVKLKEKGAAVAFAPNGKEFAVATQPVYGLPPQPIVGLYDVQSGRLLREFARRTNFVASIAFSPNGQVLAIAGGDASGAQVDVWELSAKEPKATFAEPRREVNSIVFSRDARLLALGGYANGRGFAEVHDLANGQIRTYRFGSDVSALDFSPDAKRLVVGTDKGQIVLLPLQAH